jgi:hypothetical protein
MFLVRNPKPSKKFIGVSNREFKERGNGWLNENLK